MSLPIRISGTTRWLGAPVGWEPDAQGPCAHLAIRDVDTTAGPTMQSAWEPTPEELARLAAGAPIVLTIMGNVHPPVELRVGHPPNEEVTWKELHALGPPVPESRRINLRDLGFVYRVSDEARAEIPSRRAPRSARHLNRASLLVWSAPMNTPTPLTETAERVARCEASAAMSDGTLSRCDARLHDFKVASLCADIRSLLAHVAAAEKALSDIKTRAESAGGNAYRGYRPRLLRGTPCRIT